MATENRVRTRTRRSVQPEHSDDHSGELKFVEVQIENETGGGWYREIDASEIEVLSRARLERVPLEDTTDPAATARKKIAEMIKPREGLRDRTH
ncbi:MAG TPA: hypothetical protein VFS24_01795 [Steroidobacteraceae bacterium]|nr:hypothetical protein [Steroidobacteraceae bacterium]